MKPPVAERRPKVDLVHGDLRQDDYAWLRDKNDRSVRAYLEAENAYAEQAMRGSAGLRKRLYDEMLARIKETDTSVPYRRGEWLYYVRTEKGLQYAIYCRKRGTVEAPEEVILDLNALAVGHAYLGVGDLEVSDDGSLLAYSIDTVGFREYTLHVKDLRDGSLLADTASNVSSLAWAADGRTLFYTTEDDTKRSYRLHRLVLGSVAHDLVFEERDELFQVGVARTRSGAWLMLQIDSHTTSEVRVLPGERSEGPWRVVAPRVQDREYEVDHRGDSFYIRINDTGRNFRLVTAPVADPAPSRFTEIVAHRSDVMLTGVDCFANHLVLSERENGLPRIRVTDLRTGEAHRLTFPEPSYQAALQNNREWDARTIRYSYQSLVTPPSVYDYDVETRRSTLRKTTEVLGGFDPTRYTMERIQATADDGTQIPISLVYRSGLERDGRAPLWLGGYGAYGLTNAVVFSSNRLSLLDRGAVVALAHVRGGGEMGKAWHDQGRMANKPNTFIDFIRVAEHLIAQKYTTPSRLIVEGGSAGGLLMGVVSNLRPELFRAVIAHVPFVDVVNTMLDASLPLTIGEYEEWGNPHIKEEYETIKGYCPYTNLAAHDYPAMLVKASLEDSQVMFWEPAKYVAKLRMLKTDTNPLLLVTNMGAGHGGSSGRYDRLGEIAFDYAFMLDRWGIGK